VVASLARDAGGDVIGSGSQQLIPHGPYSFTVFKQSGLTGAQLWQNDIVDVVYEVNGRRHVASGLPMVPD